jgi:hypothetical protein
MERLQPSCPGRWLVAGETSVQPSSRLFDRIKMRLVTVARWLNAIDEVTGKMVMKSSAASCSGRLELIQQVEQLHDLLGPRTIDIQLDGFFIADQKRALSSADLCVFYFSG